VTTLPGVDAEIRLRQAEAIHTASGADDCTCLGIHGASRHLPGHRRAVSDVVVDRLRERLP
jgi:hypothetical protein